MVDGDKQCAKSVLNPKIDIITTTYITSSPINENVLKQKYEVERLSMREVATQLASSKTTIRKYLLKYNIPIRETGKASNLDSRVYGQKKISNKKMDHKREQRVIDSIIKMHKEGLSCRATSRVLNEMKTPTKKQGKKWHHDTVSKIIQRAGHQ
jgi:proline dehydrogenase